MTRFIWKLSEFTKKEVSMLTNSDQKFGVGFGDELITTGLVLTVVVGGSFFVMSRLFRPVPRVVSENDEVVMGAQDAAGGQGRGLAEDSRASYELASPTALVSPSPSTSPTKTPSSEVNVVEIPYGPDQEFENDFYYLRFINPRLISGASLIFKVDVELGNKTAEGGVHNRIHATVVKDAEMVIEKAAMSNTEITQVNAQEKVIFTASLSLIQETDIEKLIYEPGADMPRVVYYVGVE